MRPELLRFRRNIFSQHGEDGVLAEILRRLGISGGWFCEFGAWDGRHLSNTFHLLENGWQGVMIEGDAGRFEELQKTAARFGGALHCIGEFVASERGPKSLDGLLARTPIPRDFEVLSVDVDGPDYHIWNSLTDYQPLVVIIEINSNYPPGARHVDTADAHGSSFTSMIELGKKKGYVPLVHTGNLFFVREDRAIAACQGQKPSDDDKSQFLYTRRSAAGHIGRVAAYYWQRLGERFGPLRRQG